MANYALILASGVGSRTGQAIPKQFISVNDKPIIIYTLEKFQECKDIDGIVVVCLQGWEEFLKTHIQQYNISKVIEIVEGGNDRLSSIFNGINSLKDVSPEDIIIQHDSIRPCVTDDIILNSIATAKDKNIAVSFTRVVDTTYISNDFKETSQTFDRDKLVRGHTPVSFTYSFAKHLIDRYKNENIENAGGCMATLALACGYKLYGSKGSDKNFKITTKDDLDIFKGLILLQEQKHNNLI